MPGVGDHKYCPYLAPGAPIYYRTQWTEFVYALELLSDCLESVLRSKCVHCVRASYLCASLLDLCPSYCIWGPQGLSWCRSISKSSETQMVCACWQTVVRALALRELALLRWIFSACAQVSADVGWYSAISFSWVESFCEDFGGPQYQDWSPSWAL